MVGRDFPVSASSVPRCEKHVAGLASFLVACLGAVLDDGRGARLPHERSSSIPQSQPCLLIFILMASANLIDTCKTAGVLSQVCYVIISQAQVRQVAAGSGRNPTKCYRYPTPYR